MSWPKRLSAFLLVGAYSVGALAGDCRQIPFETLHEGWHSGVHHASIVDVHTQENWDEFWRTRHDGDAMPSVDFDTHIVVAFYLGGRPSGGYGVRISRIDEIAGRRTLQVTETSPGDDCLVITVEATPYHYVVVPNQSEWIPLDFSLTRVVKDCG